MDSTLSLFGPGGSKFKTIDSDSDGKISRSEFTTSISAASSGNMGTAGSSSSAMQRGAATSGSQSSWGQASGSSESSDATALFSKLDADNDGFLSQSEVSSAQSKMKK